MGLGIGIFELLGWLAVAWVVIAFFSFGEPGCANFLVGIALLLAIGISIQNFFTSISPYLIWLSLVPLIPTGLWLGKTLENRQNPVPKPKYPKRIPWR
jgi:hypothetical protein